MEAGGSNFKKSSKLNKEFDLDIAKTVVKKNWLVIPLVVISGLMISYVFLRYTKPLFKSQAVIQRSSSDEGKRILDIDNFEQEDNLSEDVELLRSTFLLEKALKNLNLNISYFSEGEILTEEKYLMSSYHITLLELKDSTLIGKPIVVNKSGDNISLSFSSFKGNQVIDIQANEAINNEYFNLIFKINRDGQFEESVTENSLYFVFNDYMQLTNRMHPNLSVYTLNSDARTIEVAFESNNTRLATDVVSSVINTFFQYDLEKKSESSASILDFIDTSLDSIFIELKESEYAIQSFRDSTNVNDPKLFTQKIMERTNLLQNDLMEIDLEWGLILEVEKSVEKSERIEIYSVIPAIVGTPYEALLAGELEKLHTLLVSQEDLSYGFTDKNDQIKKIKKKISSQNQNIRRIINSIKDQLKFKKSSLQDRIYSLESQLFGIPGKEMELARLNRMFNLNEKYYTLLIESKTQYAISKAGYTMDNMVLQSPTVASLIFPNKKLIYTASIILSLLIALIYLLIRYLTFNEIHNPDELKKLLTNDVGFLGIVPTVDMENSNSVLIVHEKPKSALAESYRHIRSDLQFILAEDRPNVIAVSSSISGEGKTFVALNLAGILTMSGKKVLVLDLDLRKPKLHLGFNTANNVGMSSVLASKVDWKECVNKSEVEGLDFITAGPIPPNPSELIISGRLEEVIELFKKEYDLIVIDNPPVGIVSDGISVLNQADCPIYVFRANYSKRMFAQRVKELVETKKVKKLFVVLNGIDIRKNSYGYGYGYGYGEYTEDGSGPKKKKFWKRK